MMNVTVVTALWDNGGYSILGQAVSHLQNNYTAHELCRMALENITAQINTVRIV